MKAVFIELSAFEKHRESYLDDVGFSQLQIDLMANPLPVIPSKEPADFANFALVMFDGVRASGAD